MRGARKCLGSSSGNVTSRVPYACQPRFTSQALKRRARQVCSQASTSSNGSHVGLTSLPQPRPSTTTEALFNCVNILLGCGVLTIPYALAQGGWSAFGVLALIGTATNYTGKILIACQEYYARHEDAEPPSTIQLQGRLMASYEDIAEAAFGRRGRHFMQAVLYTELLGTCALFLILEKDHAGLLLRQLSGDAPFVSDATLLALALLIVLPTTWLPDLSALSYVGAAGFASALALTGLVVYMYCSTGGAALDTTALLQPNLPVTLGLLAFVFAGHAVFPAIYKDMDPSLRHEFPRVLDTTYLIVAAVCVAMGFCGYSVYGSSSLEEVTMNLPAGALAIVSTGLVLVSPITKFALTLEPVAEGADAAVTRIGAGTTLLAPLKRPLVRTGLAGVTLLLAWRVPFFGAFMAVLGAFLTLTVSVVFPCAAHWRLNGERMTDAEHAINALVLLLGLTATVVGTSTAVAALQPSGADLAPLLRGTDAGVLKTLACSSLCTAIS